MWGVYGVALYIEFQVFALIERMVLAFEFGICWTLYTL